MYYKYYSRIFFKKNNPRDFNTGLVFPLIATILCSLITITTYSIVGSLESTIIDKVVAINSSSKVYIDLDGNNFNRNYQKLSKFLDANNRKHALFLDAKGLIVFDDKSFKIVNVIGVEDLEKVNKTFDLKVPNLKNKILIGDGLKRHLDDLGVKGSLSLFAPLDGFLFVPHKVFQITKDTFSFASIYAIEQISENYVFIDYQEALDLFANTRPHVGIGQILDKSELDFIYSNIDKVRYKDWRDTYPLFFSAIKLEKYLYTSFGFLLIIIASFNLYGIINLIIYRKINQFSALIYKGESIFNIRKIFIMNIMVIGFFGSLIGTFIAYLLLELNTFTYFTPILDKVDMSLGFIPISLLFNLIILYIGVHISIKNSFKEIVKLKSNVVES